MDNTLTPRALSATSITGTNVTNLQNESLGEIEDLMIDLNTGRVSYAVLSFGGILGIGDKLFAVPLESFSVDADNENFVLNMDKDRLEDAPGFDKNDWPATSDTGFRDRVYSYYEIDPYWR